jgi:hypothetical protein
MSIFKSRIWNQTVSVSAEVVEVSGYLIEAVNARAATGRERALYEIARDLDMPASRVAKIIRLDLKKIWAHEYVAAQRWYVAWCEREAKRHLEQAALLEARTNARRNEHA